MPNDIRSSFATDYQSARGLFRQAAEDAIKVCGRSGSLEQFQHPECGPDGGALYTDAAWIGLETASRVLVTVSGTHGVEGFCGSGAQVHWLTSREWTRLPADTGLLMIHAVNPYGFAWCRRVTHENIDLNRNWVDFGAPLPSSDAYDDIADIVEPHAWNQQAKEAMLAAVDNFIKSTSQKAFLQAVSGGQYKYPAGLFYGGQGESWSRSTLCRIVREHLSKAKEVAFLDYHSGLGPSGFGEFIVTASPQSGVHQRARSWYGARVAAVQNSVSAAIAGDWLSAMPGMLKSATVTGVAIEFGTVDVFQVLQALVADNWLHTRASAADRSQMRAQVEAQVRAAFYCDNDMWRGMVLGQSMVACRQALNGLQAA
jgi:hypothetical protein